MSSIAESKRQVKAGLEQHRDEVDHDAILASLQDEFDKHNKVAEGSETSAQARNNDESRASRSSDISGSMKFRFKDGISDPRKRKHHSRGDRHDRKYRRRKEDSRSSSDPKTSAILDGETAHPFPREPVNVSQDNHDPNAAFRESLFDALADDEGAAYWESVYSQPIHVYERPSLENSRGELEQMDDEEYAAYVQTKMWERKHPEIVREREKRERQKKEDEEETARRRAEFVRKKERAAWERAQGWTGHDSDEEAGSRSRRRSDEREYRFTGNTNMASERQAEEAEYAAAWSRYLAAWDKLRRESRETLDSSMATDKHANIDQSARLPWPVLKVKSVTKPNVQAFIRNAPSDVSHPKLRILKAERVRWHPDKIQQRFGGKVDEDTMKTVTGVFQAIDDLFEEERRRAGK